MKLFDLPAAPNPRTIYEAMGDGKRFLVRENLAEAATVHVVVNWESRGKK
jgi:hypothetical protein